MWFFMQLWDMSRCNRKQLAIQDAFKRSADVVILIDSDKRKLLRSIENSIELSTFCDGIFQGYHVLDRMICI